MHITTAQIVYDFSDVPTGFFYFAGNTLKKI